MSERKDTRLEPRVAKLEVGLDRLTDDVRDLAMVVRQQGSNMEGEIQKLVVAVTQASGPKKTDWQTIIAGISLIMAIGAAVFWPLSRQVDENKTAIEQYHASMVEHQKLDSHPVGMALIKRLEENSEKHELEHQKQITDLRTHFHEELDLLTKNYEQNIKALEKTHEQTLKSLESKVDLHNDRLYARVVRVEEVIQHERDSDLNELRLWRLRAMNGDIQSKAAIGNDIIFDPHVPTISEPKTTQTPSQDHK